MGEIPFASLYHPSYYGEDCSSVARSPHSLNQTELPVVGNKARRARDAAFEKVLAPDGAFARPLNNLLSLTFHGRPNRNIHGSLLLNTFKFLDA